MIHPDCHYQTQETRIEDTQSGLQSLVLLQVDIE